jgi:putative transposase
MRTPLRRFYGRGDLHFITFSCYRRRANLGTVRARDRFVRVLDELRSRYRFRLFGYVVMPEHVHLLLSEPEQGTPSSVLQVLKQKVSRTLRRKRLRRPAGQLSLGFGGDQPEAQAFWQRRFYDFNVWSTKKIMEKLEYMHDNPVKRKLVLHAKDWPWSSWSHYAKKERGLLEIDPLEEQRKPRAKPHP